MRISQLAAWGLFGVAMSSGTFKARPACTTEFMPSTTGKTWWTEEGLVKQGQHGGAFVSVNDENLLQNMAKEKKSIC